MDHGSCHRSTLRCAPAARGLHRRSVSQAPAHQDLPLLTQILQRDINYLNCASPPPGSVSTKQQRDKYRQKLLAAFEPHYHPDHCVPSEFKEAFPAGRFRPVCKIQAKRGAASTAVADMIKPPEWWHSTRIIQAFDAVLQDKV